MFYGDYFCDRCGRAESARFGEMAYYRLGDGREVHCHLEPAWCYRCNRVEVAEMIPDTDRMEAFVDQLRSAVIDDETKESAKLFDQTPKEYRADQLEAWSDRLEWRRARKSPPKCVGCGESNFQMLWPDPDESTDTFSHPECGGTFRNVELMHGSSAFYLILDAEGRFLCDQPR